MKNKLNLPNDLLKPPKVGDIIEGKIIGVGKSTVYLDLGAFGTGIVYGKEFYEGKDVLKEAKIGDTLPVKILSLDNEEGFIELSVSQAKEEMSWQKLAKIKQNDETIKVKILGANKGGLLTKVFGITAFLPVSQLSPEHYPRVEEGDQAEILKRLKKFVGKEMEVKILDLSQKEEKLILSEKAKEIEKIKEKLKHYKVGDVVEGEITGVLDFGAFIKFGDNLDGLIHISELDWRLIEDPTEIVKVGDKVKAKIIDISNGKVSLSLKALKENPWKEFAKKHKEGEEIAGTVSKFDDFGAFIKINENIQGLCHISQFGSEEKMKELLEVGKKYTFKILSIDPNQYRLTLALKPK
jgi:small subunit ribosomal protein S1